ncbi:helix-turn-helix transcriptional regulator [Nocardioides sp. NPDC023903]|uniref:helix-turn-helix domain-containing protein n=1 Tax=Nocardioides sp. NPDC023903 TaxID=3157195 RepID=UPI0033FEDF4E
MTTAQLSVGELLRDWRERRRRSQLEVAIAADVSARHLSFIETGRSGPSRTMIERLCEELEVPLRERNRPYLAAGFAPVYQERPLDDLGVARSAVEAVLTAHEPYPACAVDVRWDMVATNRPMELFLAPLSDALRQPRLNMLRATLHPDGLAAQVRNYTQWRAHVVGRIRRQLDRTAADGLAELLEDVEGYPAPRGADVEAPAVTARDGALPVLPLLLRTSLGDLSFLYVLSVIGAPRDVTVDEIAVEAMFPADDATREALLAISHE